MGYTLVGNSVQGRARHGSGIQRLGIRTALRIVSSSYYDNDARVLLLCTRSFLFNLTYAPFFSHFYSLRVFAFAAPFSW